MNAVPRPIRGGDARSLSSAAAVSAPRSRWRRRVGRTTLGGLLCFALAGPAAFGQPLHEGEAALLYATHCRACHTEQVHWRDRRLVKDWSTLLAQVRRWQANLGLGWSEEDIRDVAHYLNLRYYRFAPSAPKLIVRAP